MILDQNKTAGIYSRFKMSFELPLNNVFVGLQMWRLSLVEITSCV